MTAPDFRDSMPLPSSFEGTTLAWLGMIALSEAAGSTFVRMTIVSDEHPNADGVPHGLYLEGWKTQSVEQPPFTWPQDQG